MILVASVDADIYQNFSKYVNSKNYVKACRYGKQIFASGERDEKIISVIGQICLKADFIDTTSALQSRLRKTKEARINAVVFSSVLLQKRLIYQFMYDGTDISTLALPVSNHPLSDTFVAIRDNSFKQISDAPKVIEFQKNSKKYKVYIDYNDKGRVIIEILENNKITIHRYL